MRYVRRAEEIPGVGGMLCTRALMSEKGYKEKKSSRITSKKTNSKIASPRPRARHRETRDSTTDLSCPKALGIAPGQAMKNPEG